LPIADLGTFIGHETLDQQDAPTRKIGIPLPEAPPVAVKHSHVVVTAIIHVSEMSDDLVEAVLFKASPLSESFLQLEGRLGPREHSQRS